MNKVLNQQQGENWTAIHGDSCEVTPMIPDASIGYSIYSVPFASLYTYSNSERDFGNCKDHEEFFAHMQFLIRDLLRVHKPGRLTSIHCMNLPTSKSRDGVIGITDFRGAIIRAYEEAGWIYHSEVCIWKDPVTAMQRTKALGLLHKTLVNDSSMTRQGIPDYLVTMRAPGENKEPIAGNTEKNLKFTNYCGNLSPEEFNQKLSKAWEEKDIGENGGMTFERFKSVFIWQMYASPVWMDIDPGCTLQYRSARQAEDERHICPLQLQVIERGLELWSNPNDTVLSPFMGIGSEGVVALRRGRKFIGIELNPTETTKAEQGMGYFPQACENLRQCEKELKETFLL